MKLVKGTNYSLYERIESQVTVAKWHCGEQSA